MNVELPVEISEELAGFLEVPEHPEISQGYAEIYQGVWTNPQGEKVEVALKELKLISRMVRGSDQEAVQQSIDTCIKQEVDVWSQIKHPNLHPVIGYRSKPQPRIISPWCRHGNITDYILQIPSLSRFKKLQFVYQVALGLDHLHSQSPPIYHGAIKPENVLINDRLEATLSDFGLSRLLRDLGQSDGVTGPTRDTAQVTFNYTAPELFAGQAPGRETDVYAFGGLILAVMSGKPPFWDLSEHRILFRAMQDEQPKPEDHANLPPSDSVWALMRQCWDKTPTARPAMQKVLLELGQYIYHEQSNSGEALRPPDISIMEAEASSPRVPGKNDSSAHGYKCECGRSFADPSSVLQCRFTHRRNASYGKGRADREVASLRGSIQGGSNYPTTSSRARAEARAERESAVWKWEIRHGRGFVVRNKWFQMPIDPTEYARWDIQHDALRQAVGLCYQSYLGDLIPEMLCPRDGTAPRVLDVGTGSGKWAIEIAKAFPQAEVLGIDYQKPPMNRELPVNCRFEQDDVNLGLEHYANTFDIVHGRAVDLGIDDYPGFLYDMARILRPGGIILLFKPALCLFQNMGRDVNGEDVYVPMPEVGVNDDPPGYQLQKVMCLVDECVKKRGGSEDAWMYYRELLEANPNFETDSIRIRWLNVPVCLFPPNIPPDHLWICQLMEENMKRCCDSWTPMMLEDGYDRDEIQRWKKLVHEELQTKQTKAYTRWTFAMATRANTRWTSPPDSRSPTNASEAEEMVLE